MERTIKIVPESHQERVFVLVETWIQLKTIEKTDKHIIVTGPDHVIGTMLTELKFYSERHAMNYEVVML